MLNRFPQISTTRIEELEHAASSAYGGISFDVKGERTLFRARANHVPLNRISLTYAKHGCGIEVGIPTADFFAQLFSVKGNAEARVRSASATVSNGRSFVCSPSDSVRLSYAPNFEQLVLKITPSALMQHLELLTGQAVNQSLRFEPHANTNHPGGIFHQNLVLRLIEMLDDLAVPAPVPVPVPALELEQAILTSFLIANHHSFSNLLQQEPATVAPWQVRRAEEYIEANFTEAVTIEDIAKVCNISLRSLYHTFKKHRGYSPMEFLRAERLKHARAMLMSGQSSVSVTDVALACGFSNLGHFAKYYRQKFHELPSDTMNRNKTHPPTY